MFRFALLLFIETIDVGYERRWREDQEVANGNGKTGVQGPEAAEVVMERRQPWGGIRPGPVQWHQDCHRERAQWQARPNWLVPVWSYK